MNLQIRRHYKKKKKNGYSGWQKKMNKPMQFIFERYYKYLVITAYQVIGDEHKARDLVQDVFFALWKKRGRLQIQGALKSYLRRAVVNRSIDELRSRKRMNWSDPEVAPPPASEQSNAVQQLEAEELQALIIRLLTSYLRRCRQVFALSRFENKSHKEIAELLDISIKTIENQMTKALKIIRKAVQQYGISIVLGVLLYAFHSLC